MKCNLICEDINNVIYDDVVLELDYNLKPNIANTNLYNREINENNKQYINEELRNNDICIIKSNNKNIKNIIVIRTPLEFDFNQYAKLYEKIIKTSINNNSKSLAMTLLGACNKEFNNFEKSLEIFKMIKGSFKSNIRISVLFYYVKEDNKEKINNFNNISLSSLFKNDNKTTSFAVINKNPINKNIKEDKYDSFDFASFMSSFDKSKAFDPNVVVTNPSDYIYLYARHNNWTLQDKVFPVLSRNEHSKIKSGKTTLKKNCVFKYAIKFLLNKNDFIHLLILSGYSLSPLNPLDVWFYEYYKDGYYQYINPNHPYQDFCIKYYDDFDVIKELLEEAI